jgi:hypothetical protein
VLAGVGGNLHFPLTSMNRLNQTEPATFSILSFWAFCRDSLFHYLGVRQQTSNAAEYGEFGRVPVLIIRKISVVKYWYIIVKQPDSLMYKLLMMKDKNNQYVNKRSTDVNKLLQN